MSDDITKLLGGLLSNPEGIKNLMGTFSQKNDSLPAETSSGFGNPLEAFNPQDDKRISLLTALKPYLNSSRSASVDKAIQLIKLTKLTENLRNEGK